MAIPAHIDTPIAHLDAIYSQLHTTFASRRTYSLDYRIYNLKQLAFLIKDNEARIHESIRLDLDRSPFEADFTEVRPVWAQVFNG